jgi:hypothetical protein
MAHEHIVYMMLVDSAVTVRDRDTILKYLPSLEELVLRDNHQPYLAIAHRAAGVAHRLGGEHGRSEERLRQALKIFETLGLRWQRARTLCELGELARVRGDFSLAQELHTQALEEFESIQALLDVERTRVELDKIINKDIS